MYDLLTGLRYDPSLEKLRWNNDLRDKPSPFLLLGCHLDRLREAASAHEWPDAEQALSYDALLRECEAAVASYDGAAPASAFKIRVTVSRAGLLAAVASPVNTFKFDPTSPSFSKPLTDSATLYGPAMTLFVDTEPTPPSGLFASTKTTERTVYNAARERVGLPLLPSSDADVIMYNPQLHITEASVSNVAFYLEQVWVTPPLASGCLPGVLRRWLLKHKRIREAAEGELSKSRLNTGDWVLLFNSVHGCRLGRITAS